MASCCRGMRPVPGEPNGPRSAPRLGVWLALATATALGCEPSRQNVLLIAVDTLRADHLSGYGYERTTSPAIDSLFDSAVVFEDAEASSAWTLPSFASLMTSLPPAAHRCRNAASRLGARHTTLAEILREEGYATAAVVSHFFTARRYGLDQGFEHYDDSLALAMEDSHRAITSPAINARAEAWLRGRAAGEDSRPWLLWLHYFDPHQDYRSHRGLTERFGSGEVDRYDGEIAFTDLHIGRLLSILRELGLDRDTLVVFVSDHGEEFGEHGNGGHGRSLHREVTRLALAIRAPSLDPRRVAEPVHAVDLLPTLLDLLEIPAEGLSMTGRSLLPVMRGDAAGRLEPAAMIAQVSLYRGAAWTTYRLGRFKLFEQHRPGGAPRQLLFDLASDPEERENLASERPEIVAEFSRALREEIFEARKIAAQIGTEESLVLGDRELEQLRALGYVE